MTGWLVAWIADGVAVVAANTKNGRTRSSRLSGGRQRGGAAVAKAVVLLGTHQAAGWRLHGSTLTPVYAGPSDASNRNAAELLARADLRYHRCRNTSMSGSSSCVGCFTRFMRLLLLLSS